MGGQERAGTSRVDPRSTIRRRDRGGSRSTLRLGALFFPLPRGLTAGPRVRPSIFLAAVPRRAGFGRPAKASAAPPETTPPLRHGPRGQAAGRRSGAGLRRNGSGPDRAAARGPLSRAAGDAGHGAGCARTDRAGTVRPVGRIAEGHPPRRPKDAPCLCTEGDCCRDQRRMAARVRPAARRAQFSGSLPNRRNLPALQVRQEQSVY